jgi:hypothetical protein
MSCTFLILVSLLIIYLGRRFLASNLPERGFTRSLEGLEYRCVAPGEKLISLELNSKGCCSLGEQTHQHPANPEYGSGPSLRPQTFADWSQGRKIPGECQSEGSQDFEALQFQPHQLLLPQAPRWSPATNRYKSIMPGFIEALDSLVPPSRADYSARGNNHSGVDEEAGFSGGLTGDRGGAIDVKVFVESLQLHRLQGGIGEKEKSPREWGEECESGMFKKKESTQDSLGGCGDCKEWETASETSLNEG